MDSWYGHIDNKELICVVFLDMRKAFDHVNYNILTKKLNIYGICGHSLNFLKSFLFNRKPCVSVNGCVSDNITLNVDVPQGSILNPLLFLLFINDLLLQISNCETHLFADDSKICIRVR